MMRRGRPTQPVELTQQERTDLVRTMRQRKAPYQAVLRSRIILGCADDQTNQDVAKELGITTWTVGKWRSRFLKERLPGLQDEPRLAPPRMIGDEQAMELVNKTLSTKPKAATHWSTRSMASEVGWSQRSIVRIWHAFGLQPRRVDTIKLSTHPYFVEKVRDVVGLYINPPERALVLSVDEKPKSKPWIAPNSYFLSDPVCPNGSPMIAPDTAQPLCLPLWTPPPEMSSVNVTNVTVRMSS